MQEHLSALHAICGLDVCFVNDLQHGLEDFGWRRDDVAGFEVVGAAGEVADQTASLLD